LARNNKTGIKNGEMMSWNSKRVLVTGAGGFIASHLVEKLIAEGASVRALVRYNSRGDTGLLKFLPADIYNGIEIIMGDLRDEDAVRAAVQGTDIIFHLGALIAIPYSYMHPREVIETNIMGTLNVLAAAREYGVRRIIHTSTSEVYGTAQYVPIDEKHPLQGQSPYSASKIGADKIVESFHRSFDMPLVTIRPFNTYGPRQSARAVIPTIISQALTNNEIRLGRLDPTRDFTYVADTVDGFLLAGSANNIIGEEINLGVGETIQIGELAQKILSMLGKPLKIIDESERHRPVKSEVLALLSNNQKANQLMGWSPKISLEEGLSKTIEWIKSHMDLYKTDKYVV
jgi:dTDP-glucose 4,6-dehydratase